MRRVAGRIFDALSSLTVYAPARRAMAGSFLAGCLPAFVVFAALFNLGVVPTVVHVLIGGLGFAWTWIGAREDDGVLGELFVLGYAAPFAALAAAFAGSNDPMGRHFWWGLWIPLMVAVLSATLGCLLAHTNPEYRATLRRRRGCCTSCGYDLRAHTAGERCPECGTEVDGVK